MPGLTELIEQRYNDALKNKDLFYFEGSISKKHVQGMEFEITFVPSLAKKPTSDDTKQTEPKEKKANPFLPPDPALVVKELDHHRIVLNKFCVVPHHILVVTKEFKEQTQPLFPLDLYATWETMAAIGPSAVAFYNCGPNSGASQPHKHVQIMPLHGQGVQPPIAALYQEITNPKPTEVYTLNKVPFLHVVMPLDTHFLDSNKGQQDALTEYLHQMFFGLLDNMFQQIRENTTNNDHSKLSYNFVMTRQFMMLVPRSKEHCVLEYEGDQVELSVNSLGFAGLLLAKTDKERVALEQHPDLLALLQQVCLPWADQ
ncbi:bifunctional AP-4-A phosphorylase/ADP sulfurylase [Apophysomyces sp. BC1015]|nr:bifunctional AP-4-A phosphorylase/ADP sulfurylase [Apophysomyces sp. BC1015]KAG0181456.1 bifunctional AP-4-A phosphorylase/ADP sulfurylase [Apophysomyces sp. BC1021]